MIGVIILLAMAAWATVGVCSVIYNWTADFDLEYDDLPMLVVVGSILGLFAMMFFWTGWKKRNGDKVLIERFRHDD